MISCAHSALAVVIPQEDDPCASCDAETHGTRVTTIVSRPTLPAPSDAVNVIELAPNARGMLAAFQDTKTTAMQLRPRLALPLVPVELLDQVT
jgi:hypothetical protein